MVDIVAGDKHDPQVGDIWESKNGWHILLIDKPEGYDVRDHVFSVIYLEDGATTNVSVDWLGWHKVA